MKTFLILVKQFHFVTDYVYEPRNKASQLSLIFILPMLIDSCFILASPAVKRDQAFIYLTGSYSRQLNESSSSSNTCANMNYYGMRKPATTTSTEFSLR